MRVGILCLCVSLTSSHCQHGSLFVTPTNNAFLMSDDVSDVYVCLCDSLVGR